MTLFQFSLTTSLIISFLGLFAWVQKSKFSEYMLTFSRSNKASVILLTVALGWFIFRYVLNLSEADFGNYKLVIAMVAVFIYFGSFALVKDFLSVRALCIICLFYSREVLDAAWLQDPPSRLFLVSVIYIMIILSLYLGAWPYRFRDFFNWLGQKTQRVIILKSIILITGLLMLGISFSL
jgi:hypothetical protein